MKIDLVTFQDGLKEFYPESPPADRQIEYISVWSQSPETIVTWILDHKEMSLRLQKSLYLSAPQVISLNKQTRSQLLASIETKYKESID